MVPNRILQAMREKRKALGVRLTFPSPEVVDILGTAGLDFVFVDYEHGVFDLPSVENICRAADLVGLTPIARTQDISDGAVTHLVDRGIWGIIGPHIETRADAQQLVRACRFGPIGRRSFGGGRGTKYQTNMADMPSFLAACNANMLVGAMIESTRAIDNLDEILSVEGIDYFMFGPADFAQDMGFAGQLKHPAVLEAVEKATARIHAAGKPMREDIMVVANARELLAEGAAAFVAKHRPKS